MTGDSMIQSGNAKWSRGEGKTKGIGGLYVNYLANSHKATSKTLKRKGLAPACMNTRCLGVALCTSHAFKLAIMPIQESLQRRILQPRRAIHG